MIQDALLERLTFESGDAGKLSAIPWPDSGYRSIDHIIPLSRGGAHSYENCQISHLLCNIKKGASQMAVIAEGA